MTGLVWQPWTICPCGHTVLARIIDNLVDPVAHLGPMTDLCPSSSSFALAWDGDWIPDVPRPKRRAATVEPVG